MLLYFMLVKAIYFYHISSGNFLGMTKLKNFSSKIIIPVEEPNEALNFKIVKGRKENELKNNEDEDLDTTQILLKEKNLYLTSYQGRDDDRNMIILNQPQKDKSQKFKLVLQHDGSYILNYQKKCVKYDEIDNYFRLGPCKDLNNSKFNLKMDIGTEKKYKKIEDSSTD